MSEINQPQAAGLISATPIEPPPPPAPPPSAGPKFVTVRVLVQCQHGAPNDVVKLPVDVANQAIQAGQVDATKAAVAYASALPQNTKA